MFRYLLGVALSGTLLIWITASAQVEPSADARAHHRKGGFANPLIEQSRNGGIINVLRSRLFSGAWQSYDPARDIVPTTAPELAASPTSNATVTWIGHSTVLIQHQGVNVLTDPMFSDRASPLSFIGPRRISQPAVALDALPPIHAVVISHDHYDHLDTASIRALGDAPTYFVPLGLQDWFVSKGIDPARVVEMDWWDSHVLQAENQQLTIVATPSQHLSGRGLTDRNRTLWASWGIAWNDFHAWFAGDTGYNAVQFKEIGARLPPIDLSIIPIGAYEPRAIMSPVHVNPTEAVLIHQDLRAAASMAIHWGAFILTAEGALTPRRALAAARHAAAIEAAEFAAFAVGETRHYPARVDLASVSPRQSAPLSNPAGGPAH